MREIKVRGKSVEPLASGNDWLTGFGIHKVELTDGGFETWLYTPNGVYEVYSESVGEYTGLKDKNGVEIYEGDIIKDEFNDKYQVKYLAEFAAFACESLNSEVYIDFIGQIFTQRTDYYRWEVKGNIHENPELLEDNTP